MKELACQRTPTPFSTALAAEFALSLGLEPDKMFVSLCKSLRNVGSGKKTPERSLSSQFQRLFGGPHRYSNILIVRPKCINRCSCFPNPQNAQFWIWKKMQRSRPYLSCFPPLVPWLSFGVFVVVVAVSRVELFGVHSLSENPRNCSVGHMTSTTLPQCGSGLPRDRATDWMLKVWAARTRAKLIIIMT